MIYALKTGSARIKSAMKEGRGATFEERRQAMLSDPVWIGPIPIHVWLIEHSEGLFLVDTGQLSGQADTPIVRWILDREDEIDVQLQRRGFTAADLRSVVLTHLHSDHMNGVGHFLNTQIFVSRTELDNFHRAPPFNPIAEHASLSPFTFLHEAFGAFDQNLPVTQDGSIRIVPTPGHTLAHASIIVVENNVHYFLAGDVCYSLDMLLEGRVDGVSQDAARAQEAFRRTLAHATRNPTVFLPSHDPASEYRLSNKVLLKG
jgi:N-acyl homoserine lactone hydrolase